MFISIDRWLRVRFPFKSSAICIPKYALIAVGALIILDILFHSHILTPMFGTLIPGFSVIACGSADIMSSYNQFYYMTWSIIKVSRQSNKNIDVFYIHPSFRSLQIV